MKRLLLIAALVACGDKKSEPPAANVGGVIEKDTPLGEARILSTTVPKREPRAWVALAHAQTAAKRPEAKATLDAALAAARADNSDNGAIALVHAVELAPEILDEAIRRVEAKPDLVGMLLAPPEMLAHEATIDRLAALAVKPVLLQKVLSIVGPERVPAIAAKVRAASGDTTAFVVLARQTRRMGKPDKSFVDEAARLVEKDTPYDAIEVAIEAAMHGDAALAKQLVAGVPRLAHSQEAAERAYTFAVLAWIYALAGDKTAADDAEKKSLQAADKVNLDDETEDDIWMNLAAARAKRGNIDGALALIAERIKGHEAEGDVAYFLFDAGDAAAGKRVLEAMTSQWRFGATAEIVEQLARRDPEAAKALVLAAPQQKATSPGIEHVMRAYAMRGDVATVRELGMRDRMGTKQGQLDAFTALAARVLAKTGKCAEALAASKDVTANRGFHLAVIARYCP